MQRASGFLDPRDHQEGALHASFLALIGDGGRSFPGTWGLEALGGPDMGSAGGWGVSQAPDRSPPGTATGLEVPGPQSQTVCVL